LLVIISITIIINIRRHISEAVKKREKLKFGPGGRMTKNRTQKTAFKRLMATKMH